MSSDILRSIYAPSTFILLIVRRRYFCCGSTCFVFWSRRFVLFEPNVRFHSFSRVTEWPPIGKKAAHSSYDMFPKYKYLIVN